MPPSPLPMALQLQGDLWAQLYPPQPLQIPRSVSGPWALLVMLEEGWLLPPSCNRGNIHSPPAATGRMSSTSRCSGRGMANISSGRKSSTP